MNIESLLFNENFHFGHFPRKYPRVPRWISGFLTIFPNDRVWTPGRIKKESLSSARGGVGGRFGCEGHEKQRRKGVKNVIFMLAFSLCPFALSLPVPCR